MIENLLIYFRFSIIFIFLLPVVLKIYKNKKSGLLKEIVTSIGLSLGLGSFFLFVGYLFNGSLINQQSAFFFFFIIFILSLIFCKKALKIFLVDLFNQVKSVRSKINIKFIINYFLNGPIAIIRFLICVLLLYAVIKGLAYPISQWDDLVRYAAWGNIIYARGEINSHINSYPLLVPLLYTYGFLSSGFRNDYLIKLIPLAFGFLTLSLVGLLIKDFFNKKNYQTLGIFLTLCFVPFYDWLYLGYVDIAASFYFVGTFYYLNHYFSSKSKIDLIVSGLFLGLSLWAKQQTMMILISLFLTYLLSKINFRKKFLDDNYTFNFRELFTILLISLPIFLPWYVRDFIIAGTPLQIPVLESNASIENLLMPFSQNWDSVGYYASSFFQLSLFFSVFLLFLPSNSGGTISKRFLKCLGLFLILFIFAPLGLIKDPLLRNFLNVFSKNLVIIGILIFAYALFLKIDIHFKIRRNLITIFIWLVPFYLIWWLKYTTIFRYLITVIPLFVLLFIFTFDQLFFLIKKVKYNKITEIFILILLIGFVSTRFNEAIVFKGLDYIFADKTTKGLKAVDDSYIVGEYLGTFSVAGKRPQVISNDNRLAYYAPQMDFHNITPAYLSDLTGFDYFIVNPWLKEAYDLRKPNDQEVYLNVVKENPHVFKKVYEHTPFIVYEILVKDSDFIANDLTKIKTNKNDNFREINLTYMPPVLPNNRKYNFKLIRDKVSLEMDKIFYNGAKTVISIASKRLMESYEICISKTQCDYAKTSLEEFRIVLKLIEKRIFVPDRLLVDENYNVAIELEKCFGPWLSILEQISQKDSSVSTLAKEILDKELNPMVNKYLSEVARKEPNFDYIKSDEKK